MLIDTHSHLHDREFFTSEQAKTMLKNAKNNQVEKIICIGTDPEDSLAARDFAASDPALYWTFGVHPSEWRKAKNLDFKAQFSNPREDGREEPGAESNREPATHTAPPIAIGEVGLDYHFGASDRTEQINLFEQMLDLATTLNLPISFHIREAFDDFFGVIANFPNLTGVVHSFSDNKKNLKKILEKTPFYIGVNGLATYSTLPVPPLEKILLETDAPFLTPIPFRGIINEPGYVKYISSWLSTKLGVSETTIAEITTKNAEQLFHFQDSDL